MNRITLITCTKTKLDRPCKAKEMYSESDYGSKMIQWAKSRDQPWYILSAHYGMLNPQDQIFPYNKLGLSKNQCETIAKEIDQMDVVCVDFTGGRDYSNHLIPALESRGIDVVNHFSGERIGDRMRLLEENS